MITNDNSIRRTIFRDELNSVFAVYKNNVTDYDRNKIVLSLFDNSLEKSKQLYLKEELKSISQIREMLLKIITHEMTIVSICSLFNVDEDLYMPPDLEKLFIKNEKIAVFVGAGVSKLIGIPLWSDLAYNAIEYLLRENIINYFEYQKIQGGINSAKQKMTIFHEFIPKTSIKANEFYNMYLVMDKKEINPYDTLVKFDWLKITSNIDDEFLKAFDNSSVEYKKEVDIREVSSIAPRKAKKIISNFSDKTPIDFDTIYHIHGSIEHVEDTIMTTKDYIESYYQKESGLGEFLNKVFNEFNVVFIGYGLEEFEILERILNASKKNTKRYVLYPTYLNEMNYFRVIKKYFTNLGIETIGYYLDFNGFKRLNIVLTSWYQQIAMKRDKTFYKKISDIDDVV